MSGPWKVGLGGLAIGIALAVRLLAPADWDPSVVAAFGDDAVEITAYAEAQLGRDVVTRDDLGHDGKFFFIQANDPWFLAPDDHAVWLDRPLYRAQRMLFPVLASVGGVSPPEGVLWGMLMVNVLALGVGAGFTGALAAEYGHSVWWGLAFPLNLGMIDEFGIGGAGIVAFAAAVGGVVLLQRGREGPAAVLLALAVLAREAMLFFVAGLVAYEIVRHRRMPWRVVSVPVVGAGLWAVYLRIRLPTGAGLDQPAIGRPLEGLIRALSYWDLVDWVVLGAWMVVAGSLALRTWRSQDRLAWGSVGFVALAIFFTEQVWVNFYDISRATAPVLTAWVFVTFIERSPTSRRRSLA